MARQTYLFFQRLTTGGQEIPINNISDGAYSEFCSMDGPQLILNLSDTDSTLADDYGLVEGAVIDARLGHTYSGGDDYFASSFTVVSATPTGDHLVIEALESGVFAVKQPEPAPRAFVGVTIKSILQAAFPGYTIEGATSTDRMSYHVQVGATVSAMLRRLSADTGHAIWVARGVVHCIPFSELLNRADKEEPITLEYDGYQSKYPIQSYKPIYNSAAGDRAAKRHYATWDTVGGVIAGGQNAGSPRVMLPAATPRSLNEGIWRIDPCLDATLFGNARYKAGMTVGVRLNRLSTESVLDESVPASQTFISVTHRTVGHAYSCIASLGVPRK
ncbi:hypothetical protein CF123_17835 [Aeromonas veronii]|uniref:Phage tail protein n=1 Tax=Aeromonas veronii TaxID=654 RepID=A0AAX2UPQ5_AERVE|nr:hypothetical protein [Aeromonas veronii]TND51979.1 hypothetical protein CF123_17835 [Aeromonas veronii]